VRSAHVFVASAVGIKTERAQQMNKKREVKLYFNDFGLDMTILNSTVPWGDTWAGGLGS